MAARPGGPELGNRGSRPCKAAGVPFFQAVGWIHKAGQAEQAARWRDLRRETTATLRLRPSGIRPRKALRWPSWKGTRKMKDER